MNSHVVTGALAILAALGYALGQGHSSLPLLAALGAVAALRYLVRWPWWLGLLVFVMLHSAASAWAYRQTVPLPLAAQLGVFASIHLILGAVFLAQARATARRPGLLTALILPCGWVALEFGLASFSPTGTWGSMAYGFVKPRLLPVAQLAAITGWIGLTFLLAWTASMLDLLLLRRERRTALILVSVLALVGVGGGIRLAAAPEPQRQIEVALIHGPTLNEVPEGELLRAHYLGWSFEDSLRARVPAAIAGYQDQMLELLETEARGGVDLVATSEVLGWLGYDEAAAWIERARQVAQHHQTTLALGLGVYDPTRERKYENKLLIIDDAGNLAADYLKSKPTPGAWHVVGEGVLPIVEQSWGSLSAAICYDFDFPRLIQQTGRSGSQVVLAPSFDDDRVRFMHSRMATMRAIETGTTVVRPTAFGITTIVDPFGRVTARKDAYDGGGFIFRGEAGVYDVTTLYPWLGDAFGIACAAGFIVLVLLSIRAAPRAREARSASLAS